MLDAYEATVVPRAAVTFPAKLPVPEGFEPDDLESWPAVTGRLEYVKGALWFMPPTGDYQQTTASDVTTELNLWRRRAAGFVVGSNEAGMLLGGEVRGADAAVWRKSDIPKSRSNKLHRVPPVLAVEVTGRDETLELLREKSRWYLDHGVAVVWLADPGSRTVIVITKDGEQSYGRGVQIPECVELPGLSPAVDDLFGQIDES